MIAPQGRKWIVTPECQPPMMMQIGVDRVRREFTAKLKKLLSCVSQLALDPVFKVITRQQVIEWKRMTDDERDAIPKVGAYWHTATCLRSATVMEYHWGFGRYVVEPSFLMLADGIVQPGDTVRIDFAAFGLQRQVAAAARRYRKEECFKWSRPAKLRVRASSFSGEANMGGATLARWPDSPREAKDRERLERLAGPAPKQEWDGKRAHKGGDMPDKLHRIASILKITTQVWRSDWQGGTTEEHTMMRDDFIDFAVEELSRRRQWKRESEIRTLEAVA